jgi:hypothetical protein
MFRARNNKIKMREADPGRDHVRLYKAWISEQRKRGRVFRLKLRIPLITDR